MYREESLLGKRIEKTRGKHGQSYVKYGTREGLYSERIFT